MGRVTESTCMYMLVFMQNPGIHRKAPLSMDPIHPWLTCNSSTSNFIIISTFKPPGASYTHASDDPKALIINICMYDNFENIGSALLKVNNPNLHNLSLLRPLSICVRNRRQKIMTWVIILFYSYLLEIPYYHHKKIVMKIKNDAWLK